MRLIFRELQPPLNLDCNEYSQEITPAKRTNHNRYFVNLLHKTLKNNKTNYFFFRRGDGRGLLC